MGLNESTGDMYPDIVTWNPLGGICGHSCVYCYRNKPRYRNMPKYQDKPRLVEKELKRNLYSKGKGRTIFVCSMTDIRGPGIKDEWIGQILRHCWKYPENTYLVQTKDPGSFLFMLAYSPPKSLPPKIIIGTTIETNMPTTWLSQAPAPYLRYFAMLELAEKFQTMVSIEPVIDLKVGKMVQWLKQIKPKYVSIGANTLKGVKLPEPPAEKIKELISELVKFTEVRLKDNLKRITEGG